MALHSDTRPTIRRIITAGYRQMSPPGRLGLSAQVWRAVKLMAVAGVRQMRLHASVDEMRGRVGARRPPRELMIRACGWDPASQGY